MVMDSRLTHHANASSPMEVTEFGIVIEVRLSQDLNA